MQAFTTQQGLTNHLRLKHRWHAAARKMMGCDLECKVCFRKFPHRSRAMQHFQQGLQRRWSGSCCGQYILLNIPPHSDEEVERAEEEEKARVGQARRMGQNPGTSATPTLRQREKEDGRAVAVHGPLPKYCYEHVIDQGG
eukprot:TRINITY_DN8808_c0_g2_i5.p3 TRINITY_DN8808_c0_g2~~TRINITY_DN8808_c0_g2_i5.p3  ORF type:complete len:140 (-),score=29.24 TRINITY_DN8808_c0_g2_i5:321-740(-)